MEAGADRLAGQVLEAGHLGVGVGRPLGGVELEVVALQEDGAAPALARMAAARMTAVYSAGRWSVYAISDLAISKITAPASRSSAAAEGLAAVR